jgi:tetratricopeptide (TPR) repeat protein
MMDQYPVHRSVFAFDIAEFSAMHRDDHTQLALRAAVYRVVRESFTVAGIPWDSCLCEDRGDGAIVVVPAEVSKVLLLAPLLPILSAALTEHNRCSGVDERIWLRVAVHAGEITRDDHGLSGADLVLACRLLDTDELRTALAQADVPLAVIVSAAIYDAIVRHRYRGIDAAAYHPVSPKVKNSHLHGWIHLPGAEYPPMVDLPHVPVGRAPPRQLLPSVTTFVGRDPELRLLDKLSSETGRLLVVMGPPGVGKTTLAIRWANQVQDQFVDGQLHADLGGPSGPAATDQVLGRFLRALGVPAAQVPIEPAELSALFRTLTSSLRLLVVLDGAVSAEQVRTLLPSSESSMTIVTSRRRLGSLVADGARFVDVGPMPEEDGVELLARLVGDDRIERAPEWARRLVELCAGLPIALCVAGARLVLHRQWTVERVAGDLLDERRRLVLLSLGADLSVEVVFDMSYQALSPPAARLYRLLGLHPGPDFDVGLAAAALASPVLDAENLLDELLTANLVEELPANRCRLHDLIRLHSRQQAEATETAEERSAALRRMLDWYLHTATAAGRVVTPHRTDVRRDIEQVPVEPVVFDGHREALDWLDRERVNLFAAANAASQHGWQSTAWQLADAMWGLFLFRTYYNEWLQFDLLAVRATQECADRAAEAGAHDRLGLLFHAVRRNDEALEHMAKAAEIWRDLDDRHRIAGSMERFGFAYLDQGRVTLALEHFQRALAKYRELDEPRSIGLALISIGRALIEINWPAEAVRHLTEATTVLDRLAVPDAYNSARAHIALGRAELRTGQHNSAQTRLSSALATMRAVNSPLGQADAAFALGELYEQLGKNQLARNNYRHTEKIFAQLGNPSVGQVRERIHQLK